MPLQIQPNGKMEYVRTSKSKTKSGHHSHDSRDQKIADLKSKVRELEDQKEQLIDQYHDINAGEKQAVDECKALKIAALRWKQQAEESQKNYEALQKRYERKSEDIQQKDKTIRQRDSDIRQKDKQLEEIREDKKFQNGVIKKLEEQDAARRERISTLIEDKRILVQEISLRKANEDRQLAENKKLKDENTRLLDWIKKERQLVLENERRDAEKSASRRRYEDEFLDDSRFRGPMPSRPRGRWDSD